MLAAQRRRNCPNAGPHPLRQRLGERNRQPPQILLLYGQRIATNRDAVVQYPAGDHRSAERSTELAPRARAKASAPPAPSSTPTAPCTPRRATTSFGCAQDRRAASSAGPPPAAPCQPTTALPANASKASWASSVTWDIHRR